MDLNQLCNNFFFPHNAWLVTLLNGFWKLDEHEILSHRPIFSVKKICFGTLKWVWVVLWLSHLYKALIPICSHITLLTHDKHDMVLYACIPCVLALLWLLSRLQYPHEVLFLSLNRNPPESHKCPERLRTVPAEKVEKTANLNCQWGVSYKLIILT